MSGLRNSIFDIRAAKVCVCLVATLLGSCGSPDSEESEASTSGEPKIAVVVSGPQKTDFLTAFILALADSGIGGFHDMHHGYYSIYVFTESRAEVERIINEIPKFDSSYEIIVLGEQRTGNQ